MLRFLFVVGSSPIAAPRRPLLVVIGAAVTALAVLFVELADSVRENDVIVRTDQKALDVVVDHRVGWISQVARIVTLLGSTWVVAILIAATATVLLRRARRLDALFLVVSSIGTAILVALAKHGVGRSRPGVAYRLVTASGAAFPSGHAAQSIACYGALAVIAVAVSSSKARKVIACAGAAAIALVVGASRVYLGVHWLSDVVGGWLLAAAWLLALVGVRSALVAPSRARQQYPQ